MLAGGFKGEYKIITAVYICLDYLAIAEKRCHDLGNLLTKELIGGLQFQRDGP